jgi:cytochrome oxidase assembly protein ShyY1
MFGTANVVKANSITQAITIIAILLGAWQFKRQQKLKYT